MPNFIHELTTALKYKKIKKLSKKIVDKKNWSVVNMFNKLVKYFPNKYIAFDGSRMTYHELDVLSNKIGIWAKDKGIKKGDVVPLMMLNRPEYIAVWLGLCKIGAAAGLINTNLKNNSLLHCLRVSLSQSDNDNKIIIYGKEHSECFTDEMRESLNNVQFYCYSKDDVDDSEDLRNIFKKYSTNPISNDEISDVLFSDPVYYIYTSGTTGLPKAAKIPHLRFYIAGHAFRILNNFKKKDTIYVPLPIYHSNGGMIGVGSAWATGMSIVLREKFSASNYFKDCSEYNCTIGVYIGECCRYILNTPPTNYDKINKVRILVGNGLRPDIWKQFVDRFNVRIGEFYGSTEGNANLFNNMNKLGAVGYLPKLLQKIYPVKFVKFNQETEELVRDENGFCIECDINEPGEAIGFINDNDATRRFDGYTNKKATEKKIAFNVFREGDKWFRSGDLLRKDADGFVYFVDRIGDTFRWKGENVATTEVAEIFSNVNGIIDVNVYGVKVGNLDGRAGMAGIVKDESFSFSNLYSTLEEHLPVYARPYFIRILENRDLTGTFKHKKVAFRKEGFNPNEISDQLYIIDNENKTYQPLTNDVYDEIINGNMRL